MAVVALVDVRGYSGRLEDELRRQWRERPISRGSWSASKIGKRQQQGSTPAKRAEAELRGQRIARGINMAGSSLRSAKDVPIIRTSTPMAAMLTINYDPGPAEPYDIELQHWLVE